MGIFKSIFDSAYNAVKTTKDTVRDTVYNELKGIFETVAGVQFFTQAGEHWYEKGYNEISKMRGPIATVVQSVRRNIESVVNNVWENVAVPFGHAVDKMAAPVVKRHAGTAARIGAAVLFAGGQLGDKSYADKKAELEKQAVSWSEENLTRPKTVTAEQALIQREKADHGRYSKMLDAEDHAKTYEMPESDEWITSGFFSALNQYRTGKALPAVSWNKNLGATALKRSFYIADNASADTAPLLQLRYPPLEKGAEESDAAYLQRCQDVAEKRKNCEYDESTVILDLSEDTYPHEYENNPEMVLQAALEKHPKLQMVLENKNMKHVGIGVSRLGSKLSLSVLMVNDAEATELEEMPAEQPSDWWVQKSLDDIDEQIRQHPEKRERFESVRADLLKIYHGAPGTHAFHSGYSLHQYYLLQKQVLDLQDEGKSIRIVSTSYEPKELDLKKKYDMLNIKIEVGGQEQVVSLIRGTDIVGMREEIQKTANRGEAAPQAGMQYMRLSEFFAQLHVLPKHRQYPLTGEAGAAPARPAAAAPESAPEEPIYPGFA